MTMRGTFQYPEGLFYFESFISPQEEKEILNFISLLTYQEVVIHNQAAFRTVKHYGYNYDYQKVKLVPGEPFPNIIRSLSNKCARLAVIPKESIVQCLISYYPPKAGIGWHTDKLIFGDKVIGVSFLSPCKMRFQKKENEERFVHEQKLLPGSAYILSGEARYKWEHSVPPVKETRYSITFRTLA